nr:hypothetical protein [Propionibacterium freudenreichii]
MHQSPHGAGEQRTQMLGGTQPDHVPVDRPDGPFQSFGQAGEGGAQQAIGNHHEIGSDIDAVTGREVLRRPRRRVAGHLVGVDSPLIEAVGEHLGTGHRGRADPHDGAVAPQQLGSGQRAHVAALVGLQVGQVGAGEHPRVHLAVILGQEGAGDARREERLHLAGLRRGERGDGQANAALLVTKVLQALTIGRIGGGDDRGNVTEARGAAGASGQLGDDLRVKARSGQRQRQQRFSSK